MKSELNKVYFEEKNDIGYVVINDPPANKMSAVFLEEFNIMVRKYIAKSSVKGIIISGKGRHYSSGADVELIKEIVATQCILDDNDNLIAYPIWYLINRTSFDFFNNLNIPVISAVNGLCFGSGFELAMCSHIRICGKGSLLALPESTFGFLPGLTGTLLAVELIGLGQALELVLSGETISADEAMEIGLIDGVVNKKETLSYCEELMKFILKDEKPYSKKYINQYLENFNKNYKNISIT
ncbi:enoyl-CoA hydratase/isomerase family protein [Wukongibacter sp. M2B1]|uniref:enoyl-CoA hydratase/isomerase family protein n=1 Tax=Wukongibacter sp. M2B1 TaxID=3088895 RepID=UPI003D78DEAD